MLRYIFTYILLSLTIISAEGNNIDSLKKELKNSPNDVLIYNHIITSYNNNPDSAIRYAKLAINQFLERDTLTAAGFINKLAIAYYYKGDIIKCKEKLNEALQFYLKYNDKTGIGNCYNGLGVVNYEQGKLYDALQFYIKALRIKEKLNDKTAMGLILNNIGNVYKDLNNLKRSVEYYQKSIKINKEIDNKKAVAMTLNNLGLLYHNQKQYNKAIEYYIKSLELKRAINDKHGMAMTLNNLGLTYEHLKKYNIALSYYLQSLEIKKDIDDQLGTAMTYINLANVYKYQNNFTKAFQTLQKALSIAVKIGATTQVKDAYQRYYELYEYIKDYENALKYHKLFVEIKDSMFNETAQNKITELQEKFEIERKKNEIQNLQYEKEKAKALLEKNQAAINNTRTKNLFLLVCVVFLAIISIVLFYTSRNRKKINQQLSETLKQKEILFKEVHHRVKNNFQLISSILNLQINNLDDKKVINELLEAKHRIISMALVHEKLYKSDNLEKIDFKEYLVSLTDDIIKSNNLKNLRLNINTNNFKVNIEQAIHLGLIFNELITNSLKHGFKSFNEEDEKIIQIHLKHISDNKWEATYSDNGKGLPENYDLTKLESLGVNLIQLLVTQLHGNLTFKTKPATFTFDFRVEDK